MTAQLEGRPAKLCEREAEGSAIALLGVDAVLLGLPAPVRLAMKVMCPHASSIHSSIADCSVTFCAFTSKRSRSPPS